MAATFLFAAALLGTAALTQKSEPSIGPPCPSSAPTTDVRLDQLYLYPGPPVEGVPQMQFVACFSAPAGQQRDMQAIALTLFRTRGQFWTHMGQTSTRDLAATRFRLSASAVWSPQKGDNDPPGTVDDHVLVNMFWKVAGQEQHRRYWAKPCRWTQAARCSRLEPLLLLSRP